MPGEMRKKQGRVAWRCMIVMLEFEAKAAASCGLGQARMMCKSRPNDHRHQQRRRQEQEQEDQEQEQLACLSARHLQCGLLLEPVCCWSHDWRGGDQSRQSPGNVVGRKEECAESRPSKDSMHARTRLWIALDDVP